LSFTDAEKQGEGVLYKEYLADDPCDEEDQEEEEREASRHG
jgi:hypothetical protein